MAYQDMPSQLQPGYGQAPQSGRDPLLPQTALSIDEKLAQMRAKFSEQEKKIDEENDLFSPRMTDDPSIHEENVDDWLTPLQSDLNLPTSMAPVDRNSAHYQHFAENFANDPAVQAIAPQGMAMAQQLRQMMDQDPNFTYDDAMAAAARTLDKNAQQHWDEHHSDVNKPRTLIHPDVLAGTHKMGVR